MKEDDRYVPISRLEYSTLLYSAVLVRLGILLVSTGSNDMLTRRHWAQLGNSQGLEYLSCTALADDPPLSLFLTILSMKVSVFFSIPFSTSFKLWSVLGDIFTLHCVTKLQKNSRWPARLFAFAPLSVLISAHHGNIDAFVLGLFSISTLFFLKGNFFSSGIFFSLSVLFKPIPAVSLSFFIMAAWQTRNLFTWVSGCAVSLLLLTLFPLQSLLCSFQATYSYQSVHDAWGILGLWFYFERYFGMDSVLKAYVVSYGPSLLLSICLSAPFLWFRIRKNSENWLTLGILFSFLAILVLGSGWGIQYLLWPMPFLLKDSWSKIYALFGSILALSVYGSFMTSTIPFITQHEFLTGINWVIAFSFYLLIAGLFLKTIRALRRKGGSGFKVMRP